MGNAWGELFIAMRGKLTEDQVREIHALCGECRLTCQKIGEMYGVSGAAVSDIKRCNRWGYLGLKPWRDLPKTKSIRQRILDSSELDLVSGCWEWKLSLNHKGYGNFSLLRKSKAAHRVSYAEFVGGIPEGMCVLHKCDTPNCGNPDHLFLGTNQDNVDDKVSKGRTMHGSGHYRAIITEDQAVLIFKMSQEGFAIAEIGLKLGVSKHVIQQIKGGVTWNHVTGLPKRYSNRGKTSANLSCIYENSD